MNILSFSASDEGPDQHDTAAAIVIDGQLVAAAAEERFSRRKHDGRFPASAVDYCLRAAGLDIRDIDALAFPELPYWVGPNSSAQNTGWPTVHGLHARGMISNATAIAKHLSRLGERAGVRADVGMRSTYRRVLRKFRDHFSHVPPVHWFGHHQSHAAASFLTSGAESSVILTADNIGGLHSATAWTADRSGMRRIHELPFDNSLGRYYEWCCIYAGLGEFGVGKLMGLAPYGDPAVLDAAVARLLALPDDEWFRRLDDPSPAILGFEARHDEDILQPPFPQFAAAVQSRLEQALLRAAHDVVASTGSASLCLGGGVFFNCSANGKILRAGVARDLWVFPASGDAGLSVGAALLCARAHGEAPGGRLEHAYFGPGYTASEIDAELREFTGLHVETPDNVQERTASLLASGHIVAWFQGRMEFGPRALGNRSILADPRRVEMRDRVNAIKRREHWRPLAPVVKADRAAEYFELECPSPFMLLAVPVRQEHRAAIAAVVHVDGTARPQTVTARQNPALYALIDSFDRLTGTPILLNTSFNDASEPIVCTPADAIRTFVQSELDVLVLGDRLVRRAPLERHTVP